MYFLEGKLKATAHLLKTKMITCQLLNCAEFPGRFYESSVNKRMLLFLTKLLPYL